MVCINEYVRCLAYSSSILPSCPDLYVPPTCNEKFEDDDFLLTVIMKQMKNIQINVNIRYDAINALNSRFASSSCKGTPNINSNNDKMAKKNKTRLTSHGFNGDCILMYVLQCRQRILCIIEIIDKIKLVINMINNDIFI